MSSRRGRGDAPAYPGYGVHGVAGGGEGCGNGDDAFHPSGWGDGEGCFPGRRAARKTAGEDCYSPSGKDMLKTSVEKALAPPGA